jgi:hypothetical protein
MGKHQGMPKKAIFAQTEQISWVEVAAKLRDRYGWEICYFIGGNKQAKKAATLFPDTVFHTKNLARSNRWPSACDQIPSSPLDETLLAAMSFHESIYMKMLDRNDVDGSFTYHKRIESYHSQIMRWKGVLEHFKPDVVVYRIAPHTGYDYVLYALCRVLGIATVMFERTSLPGRVYPVTSFEDASIAIREAYASKLKKMNNPNISLSPETEAHLEHLSKTFKEAMPYHLKYKLKHFKKSGDLGGIPSILLRYVGEVAKVVWHKKAYREYLNERYHESLGRLKRRRLRAHYEQLAKPVDMNMDFIFVALQCEPERQTCPVGGVFGNQYLMIDLLSKLVPKDWKIYVKEHVSQFKDYQAAERSKTPDYYDRIVSRHNVELVPLSYTSFELIDHAKASATVSGSVGWESVVRGKPALLFGHSWYGDCKGVFVTHTVEQCKEAIRKIQNGYQVNRDELICFARVVERCSVRGYIDKFYEKLNIVAAEENVDNLAKAIHGFTS